MIFDNLIVIKGGAYNDIKKALRQWIDLYSNDLQEGLTFKIYKNGRENHLIQADEQLDNQRFYYLINYLNYPAGIEYKIDIEGFTIGKEENKLKGKNLLIYISPTDKDGDNVFVTTSENTNYKFDFAGKITETKERKIFKLPSDLSLENPENFKICKQHKIHEKTERTTGIIKKRFKIISPIILGAFLLSYLKLDSAETFLTINYAIGFAVWAWFLWDYKMLQLDKYYFGCIAIAVIVFLYGYFLGSKYSAVDKSELVNIGTTLPIFLLIIQRPLRFVFKGIMKREPVIDNPAPSFADFVYIFILSMSTILIPAIYLTK